MYNSSDTATTIKNLTKKRGMTIKDMLSSCGLGRNTLSNMLVRGSWIQANNLAKIADCLDCSVDYLLGRDSMPEMQTDKKDDIIKMYNQLSENAREKVHAYITGFLDSEKDK